MYLNSKLSFNVNQMVRVKGFEICTTRLNNSMKHECPDCTKLFMKPQGLGIHLKTCGKPKPMFTCLICGTEKEKSYHSKNLYCSHQCAQRASRVPRDETYYKRKRSIANEAWQRYHAKQKAQTPADENIQALQEFYANCPNGYEVDHIVPISKGGLHSLSNLQYLPWLDNRRKSDKLNWSEM